MKFGINTTSVALKFPNSMQQEWYLSQISLLFPCYSQLIPYSMTVHYSTFNSATTRLPITNITMLLCTKHMSSLIATPNFTAIKLVTVDFIFVWTFRTLREPFCGENQPLESVRIGRKPFTRKQWLVLSQSIQLLVAGFCYGGLTWNTECSNENEINSNASIAVTIPWLSWLVLLCTRNLLLCTKHMSTLIAT